MPRKKQSEESRKAKQRFCQKRRYQEIKNDPELLAIEQEKRRNKYKRRKEEGKVKPITKLTPRTQREQRKKWRENSKRYRLRKKGEKEKEPSFDAVAIEPIAAEESSVDVTEQQEDPLHEYSSALKEAVRKIRNNERKKKRQLISIINKYKKKIENQRKTIQRLNKTLNKQKTNDENYYTPVLCKSKTKVGIEAEEKWYVEKVRQFYTDDANSSITAGKKEFVTKNKIKMQKRYLNAPLKTLYSKFRSESNIRISYSYFCKLRPFWTVFPKPTNRETCLCSRHCNIDLLIKALHKAGIVNVKSSDEVLSKLCCDPRSSACLNRTCNICELNKLEYFNISGGNITFYEWKKSVKEVILKNGSKKQQQLTQKFKDTMSISAAIKKLETDLIPFFNHVFKIVSHYNSIKTLKQNLTLQDACLHVDFSENYSLKFAAEVQSFHFGGSRQQVSLHTSVMYTHNFSSGFVTPISACTISDCLRHDAPAIWAHLVPIIQHVLKVNPFIDTLHFLSDSPSSQYRNKYMFFIISQIRKDFPQIVKITWNYSEAGHGKGAPDGVGAVLKRTADRMVLYGQDIGTYDQFYDMIVNAVENITIQKVDESEIITKERLIPTNLKPFKGTLSVNQVLWDVTVPQTVLRSLSCFDCNADKKCIHGYDLGRITNNNHQYVENIDHGYVAPMSKANHHISNPKKINILSDITIQHGNTVIDPFKDPKPSTSKMF